MDTAARNTVISVRVDETTLSAIDLLVQAGLAQSRSEAVAQLASIGIGASSDLLQRARALADDVQRLKNDMLEAVKARDLAGVRALLDRDPHVLQAFGDGGDTPVLLSLYYGADDLTRLLLDYGVDLNLHEAAAAGETSRVRQLLDAAPDAINAYSHDGWTPLHLAAFFGRLDTATLLLERGADANLLSTNGMGNLPLHAALAAQRFDVAAMLLDRGSAVDQVDSSGLLPLHLAADTGNVPFIEVLITAGSPINQRDAQGRTPLALALAKEHHGAADRLRAAGGTTA